MPFLIDGHNLIGQTPGLRLSDPDDEQKLVELLRVYLVRSGKKGTVVFDRGVPGGSGAWSNSVLEVYFARPPATADDIIRSRLNQSNNPRGLILVSGDRALVAEARQAGAEVRPPREFAQRMLSGPQPRRGKNEGTAAKESGLSAAQVAAWEEEFKKRR